MKTCTKSPKPGCNPSDLATAGASRLKKTKDIIFTPERTNPMTQNQTILRHIKSLGSISPQEAFRDYQITRLAARIFDLKKAGHHIETEMREHPLTGTRYARYTLMLETKGEV